MNTKPFRWLCILSLLIVIQSCASLYLFDMRRCHQTSGVTWVKKTRQSVMTQVEMDGLRIALKFIVILSVTMHLVERKSSSFICFFTRLIDRWKLVFELAVGMTDLTRRCSSILNEYWAILSQSAYSDYTMSSCRYVSLDFRYMSPVEAVAFQDNNPGRLPIKLGRLNGTTLHRIPHTRYSFIS